MRSSRYEQGFTLTELMVVVVILALLAAVAVPAMTRDDEEERFNRFTRVFMRDLQRAHNQALANRETYSLDVQWDRYRLTSITGSLPGTPTQLSLRQAPVGIWISKVMNHANAPFITVTGQPSVGDKHSGTSIIYFRGTGEESNNVTGPIKDDSATIYFQSESGKHLARVVIYSATSYSTLYKGW